MLSPSADSKVALNAILKDILPPTLIIGEDSFGSSDLSQAELRQVFLYIENPTLGVGFSRAYSYECETETPFAKMVMRPDNCNKSKRRSFEWQMT